MLGRLNVKSFAMRKNGDHVKIRGLMRLMKHDINDLIYLTRFGGTKSLL
jgi:hypothetical protein